MFDQRNTADSLEIKMNTDLAHVDACMTHIRIFLDKCGRTDLLFATTLLAREALNNAMIHGNKMNVAKEVSFVLRAETKELKMQIEDQGAGFDWRAHLAKKSTITDENGRGHEIYRIYASSMIYNDKGNAVTLHIALS